ncbi:MAG: hypothetical protein V1882_02710 [Candidatus Omnitrophota bacterium]
MTKIKIKYRNIFTGLPSARKREAFTCLHTGKGFKVERIVSCGQVTPGGQWLCSKRAEWVIVLRGRARLFFKGVRGKLDMKAGGHVFIPAKTCHRVDWTSSRKKTIWLTVHDKK